MSNMNFLIADVIYIVCIWYNDNFLQQKLNLSSFQSLNPGLIALALQLHRSKDMVQSFKSMSLFTDSVLWYRSKGPVHMNPRQ